MGVSWCGEQVNPRWWERTSEQRAQAGVGAGPPLEFRDAQCRRPAPAVPLPPPCPSTDPIPLRTREEVRPDPQVESVQRTLCPAMVGFL